MCSLKYYFNRLVTAQLRVLKEDLSLLFKQHPLLKMYAEKIRPHNDK